ncbi:MAG: trigger factor [Dehalococcoidia bacterium]
MAVTTERLPRSLVSLQIEVEPDRVEASLDKAARRVAQQVRIPGFRPGKAPRNVVERTVGRPALLQEALDDLLPEVYNEIIDSEELEPIDQPQFDLESMEPLVVKAQVPVRPTVELNDYQSLRAPKPDAEVTEEQLEDAMVRLRRRFATLEPVERAVEWGDTVRADVTVQVEGQGEPHVEEDAEFRVDEETVVSLPGFLERLVGLERGGPVEFSFALPDDFEAEELRGKEAKYTVTIHEVKQEILPELDDEFAKSLDEGFETVAEMRERVDTDVRAAAEQNVLVGYHDEIVDLLVAIAEMDYPEVLVHREVDRLIDEQSNHASHTQEGLDQWLAAIGTTEAELRAQLEPGADLNVRRALAIGEFVRAEGLEITDEMVDERVDELVTQMIGAEPGDPTHTQLRELLNTDAGRSQIRSDLTTKVALDRLVEICSQPDEGTTTRARGTRRRRRGASDEAAEAGDAEATATTDDDAAADDAADTEAETTS